MDLVNMKLPKRSTKDSIAAPSEVGGDKWPYGLRLTFDREQIEKLTSLEGLKVGDTVTIEGTGTVVSVRMSERQKEKIDQSIEIQIENVGVESGESPTDEENDLDKMGKLPKI